MHEKMKKIDDELASIENGINDSLNIDFDTKNA